METFVVVEKVKGKDRYVTERLYVSISVADGVSLCGEAMVGRMEKSRQPRAGLA